MSVVVIKMASHWMFQLFLLLFTFAVLSSDHPTPSYKDSRLFLLCGEFYSQISKLIIHHTAKIFSSMKFFLMVGKGGCFSIFSFASMFNSQSSPFGKLHTLIFIFLFVLNHFKPDSYCYIHWSFDIWTSVLYNLLDDGQSLMIFIECLPESSISYIINNFF